MQSVTRNATELLPNVRPINREILRLGAAMRRARQYLSGFKRSIALFLPRSVAKRRGFDQAAMLAHFVNATSGAEAEDAAVAYFNKALAAAGFLSVEEVSPIVANYTEHKTAWREALLSEAEQLRNIGLPVYADRTGPIDGGLDWCILRQGAHKDRLYQLRPHRFGFLPRLAIAAFCGADTLPALLATLEGWIAQVDRRNASDAYFSNLIVVYRLLAISWAVPFCTAMARDGNETAALTCLRLFQILAADIRYLWPRLGQSAPNNHLLADRFAAWFLVTCYPDFCPRTDSAEPERSWKEELCRQFYADGTNFEQSTHYHELGCELALVYLVISLRCGKQLQEPILTRIGQMLRFQAALADARGNVFALGDATEDPLLPLDSGAGFSGGAWQVLYRSLFDPSFPATGDAAQGAERAYWLLAAIPHIEKPFRTPSKLVSTGGLTAFPDGGYVAFRDALREELILFRTGPRHGVEVHAGHAMSDLLSVYWSLAGQPIMEPSGTYAYSAEAQQLEGPSHPRDYFRSPAASNGVILHGHDPLGIPKGRFRGRDSDTRVATRWRFLDNVLGWAEGQLDEGGPLTGYRRGVLHLNGRYTLVYDSIPLLPSDARISCHWQLAPEAEVTIRTRGKASVDLPNTSAFVCMGGDLADMRCLQGQADPPAGWVSRNYGRLQSAPQLVGSARPPARALASVFGIGDKQEGFPSVEVQAAKPNGMLLDVSWGTHRDIACIGDTSVMDGILPFDLDFQGDVLWLGLQGVTCREIRALGMRRFRSSALGLSVGPKAAVKSVHGDWLLFEYQTDTALISGRWRRRDDG